jgi:hypothetical protein
MSNALEPDPAIAPPLGVRIETERHGMRWLVSVKSRTLSSIQGIVWPTDAVFVCANDADANESAEKYAEVLRREGWHNVKVQRFEE